MLRHGRVSRFAAVAVAALAAAMSEQSASSRPPAAPRAPPVGPSSSGMLTTSAPGPVLPDLAASFSPSSLADQLTAPAGVAAKAPLVRKHSDTEWSVPMGEALEAFLYHSGPPEITRYNLGLVRREEPAKASVMRHAVAANGRHSYGDVLSLTPDGQEKVATSPSLIAFKIELRCLGTAKHGKAGPNCRRACGGFGMCVTDCANSSIRFHNCEFRVVIVATLKDIEERQWRVRVRRRLAPCP